MALRAKALRSSIKGRHADLYSPSVRVSCRAIFSALCIAGLMMVPFQLSIPMARLWSSPIANGLPEGSGFESRQIFRRARSVEEPQGLEEFIPRTQPALPPNFAKMEAAFVTSRIKTVADVEGANMDHNGSIANSCFTQRSLLRRTVTEAPPGAYSPYGLHSFVLFNAHRLDASSFAATGFVPLELHENWKLDGCMWVSHSHVAERGRLYPVYPGEHHDLMYESVILKCQLDAASAPQSGGSLFYTIDGETFEAYVEEQARASQSPSLSPKYNVGFCSFPIYREVSSVRIAEWVQYSHNVLGVEYFILNDGGSLDEEAVKVLQPFINSGILEINDIRGAFQFESKHNVLILNDCIYRMRWLASWQLVLDFDEFLYVPPPQTLPSLLAAHRGKPWLTFGSLWWSVELCRDAEDDSAAWPVEKMRFHWPDYYCVGKDQGFDQYHCLNYFGHRKYVVDPRMVGTVEVHRPIEPIDGGVNLNSTVAWINHYQGLLRPNTPICSDIVRPGTTREWFKEDDFISDKVRRARLAGLPKRRR